MPNPEHTDRREIYTWTVQILGEQLREGLSLAEAVDYVAVAKADIATGKWAAIRDVSHSTVSDNVSRAREKDIHDRWGTPEAKADTILWRRESNE